MKTATVFFAVLALCLCAFALPTPTGTVTIAIDGTYVNGYGPANNIPLSNGTYTLSGLGIGSYSNGSHTVTVAYSGDSNYAGSSGSATFTIQAPTLAASQVTVTVTPTTPAPGGSVTFGITVSATN